MLGYETIRNISNVAAYRAAEEDRKPLPVWPGNELEDCKHLPFLGSYCPPGYRPATFVEAPKALQIRLAPRGWVADDIADVLVDASGFGSDSEPALTFESFAALASGGYWAIVEAGQFQVVVRCYVTDPGNEGTSSPSYESVVCSDCDTVHDELEGCDDYEEDEDYDCDCESCTADLAASLGL